jgi:hypothetical protein
MGRYTGYVRDTKAAQTEILANIEALLAQQTGDHIEQNVKKADATRDAGPSGVKLLDATRYIVLETANLDEANDDGTVTLEPGDETALIRYDLGTPVAVTAIGAVDHNDVTYYIRINNEKTIGGETNSPLGTVNAPFSFIEKLGAAIPAESLEYIARYDSAASGQIDLAARAHLEVIG